MGKEEIIKILKKSKIPLDAHEVTNKNSGCNYKNTTRHLKQLTQSGDIKSKETRKPYCKHRTTTYYSI